MGATVSLSLPKARLGGRVAVLEVRGVITEAAPVIDEILKLRETPSIKAVVLRIDSPGGAVGPSQEIHEEVRKLDQKKPVVASLGSVAASGGYYIACGARRIVANPGTLTGSIGVIMQFLNLEDLMKWARVKSEVIKSGPYKDIGNPSRPLTAQEKKLLGDLTRNVYEQFVGAVAEGRHMNKSDVEDLADGRIYSGRQALDEGLVDEMGDLQDAIQVAGRLGGISGEPAVVYPQQEPWRWQRLLRGALGGVVPSVLETWTWGAYFLPPWGLVAR